MNITLNSSGPSHPEQLCFQSFYLKTPNTRAKIYIYHTILSYNSMLFVKQVAERASASPDQYVTKSFIAAWQNRSTLVMENDG